MDINQYISYLVKISEAKLILMKDLHELTKKQTHFICEQQIEKLMDLIQKKQQLIDKVNILDKEFAEKYDALKSSCGITSLEELNVDQYDALKLLKEVVTQIFDIIEEMKWLEKENSQTMGQVFDAAKKQLVNVRNSIKVEKLYNKKSSPYGGVFIDRKK
ncbi:MAG: flagellar protein FlgN [Bacillota bacterium]